MPRSTLEAITTARLLLLCLTALGSALGVAAAQADIYTWTDAAGRVNISNLAPPEGARITSVLHESPKPPRPEPAVAASPQPDVQLLAERVRQLEWEVDLARRQPPPTIVYAAAPQPPAFQYPVQYSYAPEPAPAPAPSYSCDPSWIGCGFGWSPLFGYPATVVVLRAPAFHRSHHGVHRAAFPQSLRAPPTRQPPTRPPPMRSPPGRSSGGMHSR